MATGVLHRVSGGLGRAKSRAQSAGQLVVWSRWDSVQCTCGVIVSVVSVVRCCVCISAGLCGGYDELGLASPVTASQPSVAFSSVSQQSFTLNTLV